MDITIYDLIPSDFHKLVPTNKEYDGRIIRRPGTFNDTIDVILNVKNFSVSENYFNVTFQDGTVVIAEVPIDHYHKIEVL